MKERVMIAVSPEQRNYLKAQAAQRGISLAQMVAEALASWIAADRGGDEKRRITEQAAERARLSYPANPFLTLLEDGR